MQPKFIGLDQGSDGWLKWRRGGIGGSDAPAIMGVSPWMTAYRLWEIKTGRAQHAPANAAMQRGIDLEPQARAAYEKHTDNIMEPHCMESGLFPWMRASLDGVQLSGDVILEIKCAGKDDHAKAVRGEVPEKYIPQLQHCLAVSGAKVCHYWSYDGEAGALVIVDRDDLYIATLLKAEQKFWKCVETGTPPEMTDRDAVERTDSEWIKAALDWREAKRALDAAQDAESAARGAIQALAGDNSAYGDGVRLTRYWKAGSIEYKKIPILADVDVEQYRKAGRWEYRLSADKEKD